MVQSGIEWYRVVQSGFRVAQSGTELFRVVQSGWRLGGGANREIDFGFGCGCVARVRACEAVCGRVRDDGSPGARAKKMFLGGCPPPWALKKSSSFFQDLIASG